MAEDLSVIVKENVANMNKAYAMLFVSHVILQKYQGVLAL